MTRKPIILGIVFLLVFATFINTTSSFSPAFRNAHDTITSQTMLTLDLLKYHTSDEVAEMLYLFQSSFPDLIRIYPIGNTYEGKQIWATEITNFANGEPLTKPAMLYVGPHHGIEMIGKEIALYFMWYLLTNYGVNQTVTRILNEKTIYIIPCINLDGNDWTLRGLPQRCNSRPLDDDGDGLFDEDPPEDLNGDGKIMEMRFWNATKGTWDYYPEGLDKDGDGFCTNEGWAKVDSIGGVDLNRNYPKAWTNYTSHGAYPFSEPETVALRDFVLAHPNIATVFETHSGAVCLLHPWAHTSNPTPDNQVYTTLRTKYAGLTGYAYHRIGAKGTSDDWIYDTQSVIDFTLELFGMGFYPGNFEEDYPDVNVPWQNFTHPQLGEVQIGGTYVVRAYNPPEEEIEMWALKVLPMLIDLVKITPKLKVAGISASRVAGRVFNVSTILTNMGFLDTATAQALQTGTNRLVNVTLSFSSNVELVSGAETVSFAVIKSGKKVSASWLIRIRQNGYTWVKVSVASAKGGVDEAIVRFNLPSNEPLHVIP